MLSRVIKRSRSMRVGQHHAGEDTAAHGPAHPPPSPLSPTRPPSSNGGPGLVSDLPTPALHDASWQAVQKAVLSPDEFSDGRKLYIERPLPPPPPPRSSAPVTFVMSARPRTSGGPNAKASAFLGLETATTMRSDAVKKMSRDDMYLTGYTGQGKGGLKPYRVGLRGGLPTPESSPDMGYAALSPPLALPPRMLTPDTLSSGEIQIGMAVGAPLQPSEVIPWESQAVLLRRPLTPPDLYHNTIAPVQHQKTQRRKLFGGLFGSKKRDDSPKAQPKAYGDNQGWGTTTSCVVGDTQVSPEWRDGLQVPGRSNTLADKRLPKHKLLSLRSNTMPATVSPLSESRGKSGVKSSGSQWAMTEEPEDLQQGVGPNPPTSTPSSGPLLDIEIPSIKMERYSVMFSNVLNPQATNSSLLARRQATLEKLKTINDQIMAEDEEKAKLRTRRLSSSPQQPAAKSPGGFTLFPPDRHLHPPAGPSSLLTPQRALGRSNTSPAHLTSPSRASFDHHAPHHIARKERKTVTIISPRSMEQQQQQRSVTGETSNGISRQRASEQAEHTIPLVEAESFRFGPDMSGLILDSPSSTTTTTDGPVLTTQPLRLTIPEPEWQIINAPEGATPAPPRSGSSASSATTVTTTTGRQRSPSSSVTSSVATHVTRPSVDMIDTVDSMDINIPEPDSNLKAAVEISIARQISLSRQQRSLLLGNTTSNKNGGNGNSRPRQGQQVPGRVRTVNLQVRQGGSVREARSRADTLIAHGHSPVKKAIVVSRKEGRVVETKIGTPAEVRPAAGAAMRKSERIVLEGVGY